jgi:glycosyltransferase involved in cell wall biosynthesis
MENSVMTKGLPKISIIIVTFNAARFLRESLDSIYRQEYANLEIIIIDGASTDGTVDIIKENAKKIAFWKSEKDNGIYDAMNKALQYVTGDWVYFLGADDQLFNDFSKLAYSLKNNTAIYYGNVIMKGKKTGAIPSPYALAKKNLCHQAIIYPASVFKKYAFEVKYSTDADHLLNMQLWNDKNYHFEYADVTICDFNDTGASSVQTDTAFEKDRPALILKYFGLSAWARFMFRRLKIYLSARPAQNL